MGWSVTRQPDGKYAVFSTIVDNFIMLDAEKEDVRRLYIEKAIESAIEEVKWVFERVDGTRYPAPMYTFEEAVNQATTIHGETNETVMAARRILDTGETVATG